MIRLLSDGKYAALVSQLEQASAELQEATNLVAAIKKGDFNFEVDDQLKNSALIQSLIELGLHLQQVSADDETRRWMAEGQAHFAEVLRDNQQKNLNELSDTFISEMVKYVGANQGALFLVESDVAQQETLLRMSACYAYDRKKYLNKTIAPGEGLVGQIYLEAQSLNLQKIPNNYISISSGLGEARPDALLIVPVKMNDQVHGIIELASFRPFTQAKVDFVEKVSESLGASLSAARTREQTLQLLDESRKQASILKAQEEEMRLNTEELRTTQKQIANTQRKLLQKEAQLQALINNTDDSIIAIDRNYRIVIINQTLKDRYKGTQFEDIDIGSDVLAMLGSVRDEWKTYYDRAFAGERYNFVIRSVVRGEDSFRHYFLNPIRDHRGEIAGVSVFSRDVTTEVRRQNHAEQLIHELQEKVEQLTKEKIATR